MLVRSGPPRLRLCNFCTPNWSSLDRTWWFLIGARAFYPLDSVNELNTITDETYLQFSPAHRLLHIGVHVLRGVP